MYFDLNIEEWNFKNDYEDIYFLLHCLYNAKTELYDRTLTDMRSRYDPTEAFIDNGINGWNRHWKECVWRYKGLSAQEWINLYQQLIKENKYDSWILEYIEA